MPEISVTGSSSGKSDRVHVEAETGVTYRLATRRRCEL